MCVGWLLARLQVCLWGSSGRGFNSKSTVKRDDCQMEVRHLTDYERHLLH